MRIVKKQNGGEWSLQLEDGDELRAVVFAIARASFELAVPDVPDDPEETWENGQREIKINLDPKVTWEPLLRMDYCAGRRCKTELGRGRKYLRFFPGDRRERDAEAIISLANHYLGREEAKVVTLAHRTLGPPRKRIFRKSREIRLPDFGCIHSISLKDFGIAEFGWSWPELSKLFSALADYERAKKRPDEKFIAALEMLDRRVWNRVHLPIVAEVPVGNISEKIKAK